MIRDLTNYDLIFIFFRLLYFQNLQILADTSHVIWFGNQESTPTWALLSQEAMLDLPCTWWNQRRSAWHCWRSLPPFAYCGQSERVHKNRAVLWVRPLKLRQMLTG